jgi:hypothetical protein
MFSASLPLSLSIPMALPTAQNLQFGTVVLHELPAPPSASLPGAVDDDDVLMPHALRLRSRTSGSGTSRENERPVLPLTPPPPLQPLPRR